MPLISSAASSLSHPPESAQVRAPEGRQLRAELVGPAGAGKSTLVQSLAGRVRSDFGEIWGLPVPALLANGVQLIPTFSRFWVHSGSLLWAETRYMVRLRTLGKALHRPPARTAEVLIFDEGPVFALAWLRGFGHEGVQEEIASEWWTTAFREWAAVIDVVVVLDAPDHVLAQRIRSRARDHEVKQFPDDEIVRWMARFRDALEWVLAGLSRHGGPVVVRLSSQDAASECLAERLAQELNGRMCAR